MSQDELPKFLVVSEISISKDSFLDDVPERLIIVRVKIFQNDDVFDVSKSISRRFTFSAQKKYHYSSESSNVRPNLYISHSVHHGSHKQITLNSTFTIERRHVQLVADMTQSLERLSEEDKKRIHNQSSRTRPLKPPCFDQTNLNLLITGPNPLINLPHELTYRSGHNQTMKTNQKFVDAFGNFKIRENLAQTAKPNHSRSLNQNSHQNSHQNSAISQHSQNFNRSSNQSMKSNQTQNMNRSTSKSQIQSKHEENSNNDDLMEGRLAYTEYIEARKFLEESMRVPVIFRSRDPSRVKKERTTFNESLQNRPFFTTCQEPLKKEPAYYYQMRHTTTQIV